MKAKINSKWEVETGTWNKTKNTFENRHIRIFEREIEIVIEEATDGKVLHFKGAPIGYEGFYISDLPNHEQTQKQHPSFCICAGTINRCIKCVVDYKEVIEFIKAFEEATEE